MYLAEKSGEKTEYELQDNVWLVCLRDMGPNGEMCYAVADNEVMENNGTFVQLKSMNKFLTGINKISVNTNWGDVVFMRDETSSMYIQLKQATGTVISKTWSVLAEDLRTVTVKKNVKVK
jgi:hypothetical protein